jgi:DNA repair photolyase
MLDKQLAEWKSGTIDPVMVASATDGYQPAELRFELTRRCIEVLQKYNVPYYVFTKSTIIERDLELHRRYSHNCFIVWSITTCNEKVRRVVEPGTPPVGRIFEVIKKFAEAGVCCGVNVDPIIPLITDSDQELDLIVGSCIAAGLRYVFGTMLRLRMDIWDRMKVTLRMLGITDGADRYKQIYKFEEPLNSRYVMAEKSYSKKILHNFRYKVASCGMSSYFPESMRPKPIDKSHLGQTSLLNYLP